VENRLPALGGTDKETLDAAKSRARRGVKTRFSAVTSADFELLAASTPGLRVARVKAFPLLGPDYRRKEASVTVVVVPYSHTPKPVASQGFLATVWRHLNKHRFITTQVHVTSPDYVKINAEVLVSLKQGADPVEVKKSIEAELRRFLHPLEGGPEGEGWPFGRAVCKSEVTEAIEKIAEVDCVQKVRLIGEGMGVSQDHEGNVKIRQYSLVFSGEHKIEVSLPGSEWRTKGGGTS
jgi:predicted phage baseplate assembly protein